MSLIAHHLGLGIDTNISYYCSRCKITSGSINGCGCIPKSTITFNEPYSLNNNVGWMCPSCRSCFSPIVTECTHCNKDEQNGNK